MRFDEDLQAEVPTPKIDAFLAQVAEVCRWHGYTLHASGERLMVGPFDGSLSLASLADAFVGPGVEVQNL